MINEKEYQDIFDKIMNIRLLKVFYPFYKEYKSSLLYLFFGGIAFFMNIILFYIFSDVCCIEVLLANVISWIICVTFQFITNRTWVFHAVTREHNGFIKQMLSFYASCLFTLALEELIIYVFIVRLNFNSIVVKLAGQIVVIVTNYFLRKCFVFRELE